MAKKVVFIIAQNDFGDEEFLETKKILERRGVGTLVASKTKNRALGENGTEVEPDLSLSEIGTKEFEALIFIDGSGVIDYFYDDDALDLARRFHRSKKILSAICLAPMILGNAGALISKTVTAFPTQERALRNRGADYTGMPLEIDGRIITARDKTAIKEFAEAIVYLLEE